MSWMPKYIPKAGETLCKCGHIKGVHWPLTGRCFAILFRGEIPEEEKIWPNDTYQAM